MANPIRDFHISKTFDNVVLTTVTGQPDTLGVPPFVPYPYGTGTGGPERARGRLQDGSGQEIPMILSGNLVEIESNPYSAYSPIRRADLVGMHAAQFINTAIWS